MKIQIKYITPKHPVCGSCLKPFLPNVRKGCNHSFRDFHRTSLKAYAKKFPCDEVIEYLTHSKA